MGLVEAGLVDDALARERRYDDGTADSGARHASDASRRALLAELVAALSEDDERPWRIPMPRAEELAAEWHAAGAGPGELAREVSRLAHALEASLEDRRPVGAEERTRLRSLADEAVARAIDAHAAAAQRRRDGWLSFYAHELRNPLNTLVNAAWIMRNAEDVEQIRRVCDMVDRAVQKLERLVGEVRRLEGKGGEASPREAGKPGS
jgi:signal transduction histidine kinase